MKKKEIKNMICPYWAPGTKICKMQKAGIFIPLEDHIQIYCTSAEHILCQQYKLGLEINQETKKADLDIKAENRRQYSRIMSNHHLTLVRLSDSGQVVGNQPSRASTVDLSSGGMRLTTREVLMHDSIVQFYFKSSFPPSLKSGLAKVKWCIPSDNNLEYQAGLAFQNDEVIQAMDTYLALQA